MATMNISLPDQMKEWVEAQSRSGKYGNASDYVRDLIRHDQERDAARAKMQAIVDEAVAGGFSDMTMADVRKSIRAEMGLSD
jgi:antitoxin ParD1/3/4